jgi:hypothetical protein
MGISGGGDGERGGDGGTLLYSSLNYAAGGISQKRINDFTGKRQVAFQGGGGGGECRQYVNGIVAGPGKKGAGGVLTTTSGYLRLWKMW